MPAAMPRSGEVTEEKPDAATPSRVRPVSAGRGMSRAGHTVLALPVPELDAWVRERTRHYDASFVSADSSFVHAHVTVLGPWLPDPDAQDLARVAEVLVGVPHLEVLLAEVAAFPDGLVHLVPEPAGPLSALTRRLAEAFPQCPPYEGRYADPVPHLTLDRLGDGVSLGSVRASLGDLLPLRTTLDRVDLQRWANHGCRRLATWPLQRAGAPRGGGVGSPDPLLGPAPGARSSHEVPSSGVGDLAGQWPRSERRGPREHGRSRE